MIFVCLVILLILFFGTDPGCYVRAVVLEQIGIDSAAASTYESIIARVPDSKWADHSERRLLAMKEGREDAVEPEAPPDVDRPKMEDVSSRPANTTAKQEETPTPSSGTPTPKRVNPSYGGPLGSYWHAKNKINDVQRQHNKELMEQMQD